MERTPTGTSVGVDDPYAFVDRCDHLTDDGRCRLAVERPAVAPEFAAERAAEGYACPVVAAAQPDGAGRDDGPRWRDCPEFRCRATDRACRRCGLSEVRMAHESSRPLLEEHHLSYRDGEAGHEITVVLCRWCHARVHDSWARIDDDVSPDPEALAAREERRSRELDELGFTSARDRREDG